MAVVAGIDEAGFGPVLGPMAVSVCVFSVPDAAADESMWRLLAGAVTRRSFRKSPAVPVADSKKLAVRSQGLIHLERGVLCMLSQTGPRPRSLTDLLRRLAPRTIEAMQPYPWYAGADPALPRQADAADLALRANGLSEAMARTGLALESVRAEPILAGEYNRLVGSTRNKSVALFGITSRLIAYVFGTHAAAGPTRIVVDRQGGRIRYRAPLQRMFEEADIRIVEESARRSAYLVELEGRTVEISFVTEAETAALPVALASMVSKYVRELFMELLNDWWVRRVEGLRPTAGYYVDGRRFLRDVAAAAEGVDRSLLVRSR